MTSTVIVSDWLAKKSVRWLHAFDFLRGRMVAYRMVFNPQDRHAHRVLKDLAKFCRGRVTDTLYHPDQRQTDVLIGRHEVWLRIQQHLKLSPEQLTDLLAGPDQEA